MDASELTRVVILLPVAGVVPLVLPGLGSRLARVVLAVSIAAWATAPVLDSWRGWVLVALAAAGSQLLPPAKGGREIPFARLALCAVALALAAALLLDTGSTIDAIESAVEDDGAAIVAGGGLLAVFGGGAVIPRLLEPFARLMRTAQPRDEGPRDEESPVAAADRAHAGLYIGWLERTLLYGFVVAGAPGAVPIVVAAKSIARFPSFKDEEFAEYFLIGTLSSVVIAVGLGAAARAILGLSPLLA